MVGWGGGGGGGVCTVIFVSNPTTVLRLCCVVTIFTEISEIQTFLQYWVVPYMFWTLHDILGNRVISEWMHPHPSKRGGL